MDNKYKYYYIYKKLTQDIKQAVFNFWVKNDALPSIKTALERLDDVCVLLLNEKNEIIGEFSVYVDYISEKPYFFARIFIERNHSKNYILMQEMSKVAFMLLKKEYSDKITGLAIVLENKKFDRIGKNTDRFQKAGYTFLGLNRKKQQIWYVDFKNPKGIYR